MFLLQNPWLRSCTIAAVTVITGSGNLPLAPQAPAAPQATTAGCPFGYYAANGACYPYSWSAGSTLSGQNGAELPP